MTSRARRNWIITSKWAAYFLLLLLAATLQTVPGFLTIGNMRPIFILPVCIAVAIYEGEFEGALFGAVGGLLWDFTAMRVPGLLALGMLTMCFFAAILVQLYLRLSAMNFVLVNGAVCFLMTGVDFLFYYLMPGYVRPAARYVGVVLPTVIFTAALSPIAMCLVRAIWKRLIVED